MHPADTERGLDGLRLRAPIPGGQRPWARRRPARTVALPVPVAVPVPESVAVAVAVAVPVSGSTLQVTAR